MDNYPIKVFPKVDWPQRVNEINKPPEKLFYRGADMSQLPVQTKFLVVVGARKCSEYSKRVCQELIAGLKGYPVIIVSGLALGIDSIAHQAALDTNLTTVAVPGSGLNANVIYPRNHFGLAQNILNAGGTLLSEFDNDFKSTPWCFPQRNRIKAALSHGILIIGARQKSGTMITARLGLDYNREVMTVPHSIFEENGEGPHYLLSQGATPIRESS